ncbi:MAG: ABC transporter permease subunit [Bosea sp.]|nr:ABC transporter permease subunit [Bosea sp. (in: a-proteobacteria)]
MLRMIAARLKTTIPSLIGVIIVTFLLTRVLPGDTAAYFAGPAASKEAIADIRGKLGLDRPLPVQFVSYVTALAKGDLGTSLTTGQAVTADLAQRLPASAELTLFGLLMSMAIALPLGVLAAVRQGSWIDHLCRIIATAGVSLPVFFTGLLLVYVFYFILGWAPAPLGRLDVFFSEPPRVTGFLLIDSLIARDAEMFRAALSQILLPALTLAIFSLAPITRMTRASMLAVLGADFVRTARASGLSSGKVIGTYAFRNAMLYQDVDLWPIYDRIRCPTLVVRGSESDLLTRETVLAMAARGPRPRTVEIPDVGHAPMFLESEQIAIVRDFLLAA